MRISIIVFVLGVLLYFIQNIQSQSLEVKSFRPLPNDLSARDFPEYDQNGHLCAILKVVTPHTGFSWEPDRMGIVKTGRRTGEYWLYLPRGAQRITILHDQLGVLRNYAYPEPIQSGIVYEMVLTTDDVEIVVREREIISQWLAINSTPEGANVFINDQMAGITPFSRRYPEGTYTYRIEMPRYHTEAGRIELRGDRHIMELNLRPRYGNIEIVSAPENGMQIFLNDENTGLTTPATLQGVSSGQQSVRLQGQWYQPQTQNVTVTDNQTTTTRFTMQPAFANVTIRTEPRADILIDGVRVGSGSHTTHMLAGLYEVSARLDKHHPARQQLQIEAGRDREITLSLQAQTGHLDITSAPFNARITLNGEPRGTTPTTLRALLIGDYTVVLSLEGYGTVTRTITIREGETTEINETLPTGLPVTITSTPTGAQLSIAGNPVGTTPWSGTLAFGSHSIRLVNNTKVLEQSINVRQGGQARWEFDVREGIPVTITSTPPDAHLSIGGNNVGRTPWTGTLPFGDHNIRLVSLLKHTKVLEESINVRQGGQARWEFDVWEGWFDARSLTMVVDVYNPATGKTWMDRNLGAIRAATSSTDEQAYGFLYQWGRGQDGHQSRNSNTTPKLFRSQSYAPNHGNFILTRYSPGDWRYPQNHNLWQGVEGVNNPCPEGYRLPTRAEWGDELRSWSVRNSSGAFASPLKLPAAGYRSNRNNSLGEDGYCGHYWSSSSSSAARTSYRLFFCFDKARVSRNHRAYGHSVRCIKD